MIFARLRRFRRFAFGLTFAAASATAGSVSAQAPAQADTLPPKIDEVATEYRRNEPTDVPIHISYLASTVGKEAVPVILLHMYKGERHDMEPLGLFLQKKGYAVIMPDLRGHGQSTTKIGANLKLDAATLKPDDFVAMVTRDMDAVKRYIVAKHNAGELNVDKLCIIGAEMGAVVGVNWTELDWRAPDYQGLKQSKDVRALVLLSPPRVFRNLSLVQSLNFPPIRDIISFFVIVGGEDTRGVADARSIVQQLERTRPKPTKIEEKTVFIEDSLKTKLVGSKLLGENSLGVEGVIDQFLQLRVASQTFEPWKERRQ